MTIQLIMNSFTPIQYVMIDIANNYGLDKFPWDERIQWVKDNANQLETMAHKADNPTLFKKAIRALDDCVNKQPSGHLVALDATASGIQIMSAIAGCRSGCEQTNLINTGTRQDLYKNIADYMSQFTDTPVMRSKVKHPIMTHFYGSTAQPKSIFGEGAELTQFYTTLATTLPGASALMSIMQSCWNPTATKYSWTLPDGHTASFKVMVAVDKKIEVDECNHGTFTHRAYVNQAQDKGLSLAANIIHSIDGYIVREMYRRSNFDLLTIHDSFWSHPNYCQQMRQHYNNIFAEEIHMDLFNSILKQIGAKHDFTPIDSNLNTLFRNADYALS